LKLPMPLRGLTPLQKQFRADRKHRFIFVPSGRRSRKTLIGCRKVYDAAMRTPDTRYFLGAPTWSQAKGIFWKRLRLDTLCFQKSASVSELTIILQNNSELCLFGLDRPERIEGQVWHGGCLTEFPNIDSGAWGEHIRPVLSDTNGFCIIEGVPEGRNFYYDMCLEACDGELPTTVSGGVYKESIDNPDTAYYSWFSSDVLPEAEIENARQMLSARLFRQEYEGSFESFEGTVYYAFDIKKNIDDKKAVYDPKEMIYAGIDFNVNPMTAVLCHVLDNSVVAFKEYYIANSNTVELVRRICADYPQCKMFSITPCQSSSARQTSQEIGVTDIRIMRHCFDEHGRQIQIKRRTHNPRIVNRVNCTNSLLENGRLHIHSKMRELQKDFGGLAWKEGSREIDFSDKARGHISAALDYLCEFWFPLRSEDVGETSLDITL
jgi:hypothetical protein